MLISPDVQYKGFGAKVYVGLLRGYHFFNFGLLMGCFSKFDVNDRADRVVKRLRFRSQFIY